MTGIATAASCWDGPTSAQSLMPVISLTLVEGDTVQVARVTITAPADSSLRYPVVPVPADSVDLQVRDDSGHIWPLVPAATPGRFTVSMTVRRGATYRLAGIVMGRAVDADNRAPADFAMTRPAGDTISAADTALCPEPHGFDGGICVPVTLVAEPPGQVDCVLNDAEYNRSHPCGVFDELLRLNSRSDEVRDLLIYSYYAGPGLGLDQQRGPVITFALMLVIRRKLYIP